MAPKINQLQSIDNSLLEEKETTLKNVKTSGNASANSYIGKDKAKAIALENAKVKGSNVINIEVELDADDGIYHYEIEFKYNKKEYTYDINAKTGKIIDKEVERDD